MIVRLALRGICAVAAGLWLACVPGASALAQPSVPCEGGLTTVLDEAGNLHDACVAQAVPLPPVAASAPSSGQLATASIDAARVRGADGVARPANLGRSVGSLGRTGSESRTGIIIASALVAVGVATSLVARRRS